MIRKSIKIAVQRLQMYKVYSVINIGGLAIAMAVSLAILSFAQYHFRFEKHIDNLVNSYRIITRYGEGTFNTNTFAAFDDVLGNCPEIASYTTCYNNHNIEEAFINNEKVLLNEIIFIDKSFLDYFSVDVISGDANSINDPNTMMITPSLAGKLFPDTDPLGQTLQLRSFTRNQDSLITYTVTGIVKPMPESSHLKYEALLSVKGHFSPTVETLKSRKLFGALVYLKLFENADVLDLQTSLQTILEPVLGSVHGPPLDAINHKIQPVSEIHFTPGLSNEQSPVIRRSSLNIMLLTGFMIFIIAIMNFVIMHIAHSTSYAKAKLIIRCLGGKKRDLFAQTLLEISISAGIAFFIAVIMLTLLSSVLGNYFFNNWIIPFHSIEFWFITLCMFIIVVFVVSILSSLNLFKTSTVIAENSQPRGIKAAIPLVIFQFIMVVSLSGFAMQVNRQMNYIDNKDQGFSNKNIITIRISQVNDKINTLRQELIGAAGIESVATGNHLPGGKFQDMTFTSGDDSFPFVFGFADKYLINTLDIKPIKYFSDQKEDATDGWIINETFYKKLRTKYSDEKIASGDFSDLNDSSDENSLTDFVILGVVEDFHYASLHSEIESFAYFIRGPEARNNRYVVIRYNQHQLPGVLNAINTKMESIYPGHTVKYAFLNDQIESRYASEKLLLNLINIFSILAIFVACLGLMGLSIFISEKRSKEIGIRKVNGAKVSEILILLVRDILKWVFIAIFIATPLSWYFSRRWLEGFAYRTENTWWIYVLAGLLALAVALITVSWQTFKSARKNPVESLRFE